MAAVAATAGPGKRAHNGAHKRLVPQASKSRCMLQLAANSSSSSSISFVFKTWLKGGDKDEDDDGIDGQVNGGHSILSQ